MADRCSSCGSELAAALLVCPGCQSLVHRERLAALARSGEAAGAAKDYATATSHWREALSLLPPGTRQYDAVVQRIHECTAALEGKSVEEMRQGPPAGSRWAKILGSLGVVGLILWKLKFLLVVLLTKGKLLLLGLTKVSTLASIFLSLGVYWAAWGWKFAAAILAGIYVHEMGHVAELRRRGMSADAPMFIPGIGAFVRMREHAATPAEDARIGLAGPIWGLAATIVALGAGLVTGSKFWVAVAHVGAVINLFNLMPVWQLDGSRGFHALTRMQRWIAVGVIAATFAITREGMLVVVGLVAIWRAIEKNHVHEHDWRAFATYSFLVIALSALAFYAR